MHPLVRATLAAAALLPLAAPGAAQAPPTLPDGLLDAVDYRHVGPIGNRVSAVAGVPGDRLTWWAGAASGGVWKSTDGGLSWRPVFDGQDVQSIGAITVAPSDPNVVWVGTGESFIRSNVSVGNGVYRSTDGGATWAHVGLEYTGRVGRIVVDPRDPDVAFVAALGHLYGPQEERGLFRTHDGGATWERVLFAGVNSGAVDVVMDPANPRILYAATWQMRIWPWGRESGGPESGIWKSVDGGDTWARLEGRGLPRGTMGKIGLGVSPKDPNRVYALIETSSNPDFEPFEDHEGVLWRSDDAGASWRMVNADHALAQRPLYYTRLVVAPDDRDEVHFMSTVHTRSLDGGVSVEPVGSGFDHHDMWIDPLIPDRMIVGHDGGVSVSADRGRSWHRPQLPVAQMYHVFTDNEVPYNLYGNRQDGSSFGGPSNTLTGGEIPMGAWRSVGGCESGFAVPDTVGNDVVWSGCYEGILDRHERSTGITRTVSVWPDNPEGWAAAELRYRFQWTFPIHISPHDPNTVYTASQHVHRTRDGGQSWEVISPDLSLNDKTRQRASGGLTTEDASPTYFGVVFALAESPLEPGLIWAGTNDGRVHLTRDGGETWTDVTANLPDLPPDGTVSNIEPSRFAAGTAYLTVDRHQLGDSEPHVYRTTDHGRTWTSLSAGLPRGALAYAHVVREDPTRAGMLYLGTENAVHVSWDDGATWHSLQGDLPHAPVHWLTIQPHFNDLVVATYGRGFWIADDVSALQQLDEAALAAPLHLFRPRSAYRFVRREGGPSQPGDPSAGENPAYGATLDFHLREAPRAPVLVTIEDENGTVLREIPVRSARAGLNRVVWDLTLTPSRRPLLRTPALGHAHVRPNDDGWRAPGEGGVVRPKALPGTYVVRVAVGGEERTERLTVLPDPASRATSADMAAQLALQLDLRTMADSAGALIERLEWSRRGLGELGMRLRGEARYRDVVQAGEALERLLTELEMELMDLRLSGGLAGQDTIRWPRRLLARITSLAGWSAGDDSRPTDQTLAVRDLHRAQLDALLARWRELAGRDLAGFNRMLAERGLAPVISEP